MDTQDFDVAIIGAGTAGMVAARAASQENVSVALIEGEQYGTTCARVGCMPSKLLIAAAEAAEAVRTAGTFGVRAGPPAIDGRAVMERVRDERDRFVASVVSSVQEDFPNVAKFKSHARFEGAGRLRLDNGTLISAGRIVIATGSRPKVPDPWARDLGDLLVTSDDVFYWDDLPDSVAVFGGGVVGLELAQALHRLGVRVRLFGKGNAVGPLSDDKVRETAAGIFTERLAFLPDAEVHRIERRGERVHIAFGGTNGAGHEEDFAVLLAATGRRANVDRLGLDTTDLPLDDRGVPVFDPATLQVADTGVFVAGDANNARPLLHESADEGRLAGRNAARFPEVRAQPRRAGLSVVFCDPQIAISGMSHAEIQKEGIRHAVGEVSFANQGRARVMAVNRGLARVYGEHGTGRFLGAEMVCPGAEHLGHLLSWAVAAKRTVDEMLASPFYHPVLEEGIRSALRDLNRNLKMGPAPVKNCLDCGPGG